MELNSEKRDACYDKINTLVAEMQPIFDQSNAQTIDKIDMIEANLSKAHAFARLYIDLSNQTFNNGLTGYFFNGYHSSEQRGFQPKVSEEDDLFERLRSLAGEIRDEFDDPEAMDELRNTLNEISGAFEIEEDEYEYGACESCDGSGEVLDEGFDDEEEEESYETCDECDGSGMSDTPNEYYQSLSEYSISQMNDLDDKIVKIDDKIVLTLANYVDNRPEKKREQTMEP